MRIGILDCDDIAPELVEDFQNYSTMFQALLATASGHGEYIEYVTYKACHQDLPESADECQAYLITGSKTGVYDDVVWREPLRECVRQFYTAKKRLVGICFGHQLLADVLGGKAEKSPKGWGIGAIEHRKQSDASAFQHMPDSLTLLFSHQDQVTVLPEGAEQLYGSAFCEFGAYCIPKRVLSFQGHPEFTKEYSRRLMILRQARYERACFESGVDSLVNSTHEHLVAQWMLDFLLGE